MPRPEPATHVPRSYSRVAAEWLDQHAKLTIWATIAVTLLLAIPLLVIDAPPQASQDPGGRVYDLQRTIDASFASPSHYIGFIIEARSGDVLTQEVLSELLLNETRLRAADQRGELAPGDLAPVPYLREFFDTSSGQAVTGVLTLADAVEQRLSRDSDLNTSVFEASEEQVKLAVHRVFADPQTRELKESLSIRATSARRTVRGEEIDWWVSPAMVFGVVADNDLLGGGTLVIGVGGDERTVDKERLNRNVQELLRGGQKAYRLWGIAIDVNLESADQGEASGAFIALTVIAAVAVVGLTLRSYWAVALTGVGLGTLIVWLKGISLLVGLKGGLVIDLIVPIAMVSLGVDFAIHSVRRYQEEKRLGPPPRRAFTIAMTGVLAALALALASDAIAFLSNTAAGIEAVIQFGIAAGIAVAGSFVVLGLVLPLALSRIEHGSRAPVRRLNRTLSVAGVLGAAALSGATVILTVAVLPAAGVAMLAVTFAVVILIPLAVRRMRKPSPNVAPATERAPLPHGPAANKRAHHIDRLATLTNYRYIVIALFAVLTALSTLAALKLEATFDVGDFFPGDADFVVSLDKIDEHVGERSGEPAAIVIEGDLSELGALSAIQAVFDNLDGNQFVAHDTTGVAIITKPNILQIIRDISASQRARDAIRDSFGVEISADLPYGLPSSNQQVRAVLDYAVTEGVPGAGGDLIYTPDDVAAVLRHNPLGNTLDLTQFTVFLPGTREQSIVEDAQAAISKDLVSLAGAPGITDYGLTGSPFTRQAQLEATTKSLQTSIPIAAVASFVLLLVAFRSVRYALVTIIPIGLVVSWLYGIMWASGFALNFVTATIGAISIGVGIDFSIHLTARFREELRRSGDRLSAMRLALRGTGVALTGSAASSIVGFAIMGLAPMPLFASYGTLTAIMIFLALAASLLVLPSLLIIATPRRAADTVNRRSAENAGAAL